MMNVTEQIDARFSLRKQDARDGRIADLEAPQVVETHAEHAGKVRANHSRVRYHGDLAAGALLANPVHLAHHAAPELAHRFGTGNAHRHRRMKPALHFARVTLAKVLGLLSF